MKVDRKTDWEGPELEVGLKHVLTEWRGDMFTKHLSNASLEEEACETC